MKQIYTQYAQYNLWANERMVELFSALPDALVTQHIVSSFPSAKLTFLHIWDAEFVWLKRLQGISPSQFPSKTFEGNMQDVYNGVLQSSADFQGFVEEQLDGFFEETLHFRTIAYGEQSQKVAEMVHHCLNHSTYHRGQLTTMARQLGLDKVPSTDLMFYLRNLEEARL